MNLEVDVMEGDEFSYINGYTRQHRGTAFREIGMKRVPEWIPGTPNPKGTHLDLPTFIRYCEGCGLTVKIVKPEPQVETIKPPEFAIIWPNGAVNLCKDLETAERQIMNRGTDPRIVRIDWGAK